MLPVYTDIKYKTDLLEKKMMLIKMFLEFELDLDIFALIKYNPHYAEIGGTVHFTS